MSVFDQEIEELRAQKDQLKLEVNVEPILVSTAIQDLMAFMEENKPDDKILSGFANKKDNPYEEKGGCIIINHIAHKAGQSISPQIRIRVMQGAYPNFITHGKRYKNGDRTLVIPVGIRTGYVHAVFHYFCMNLFAWM